MKLTKNLLAVILAIVAICNMVACSAVPSDEVPAEAEGDWAFAVNNVANAGVLTEQAYYYLSQRGVLTLADLKTGTGITLCSRTGCQHKTPDCEANLPLITKLFFWNGYLYYFEMSALDSYLYRRDATGAQEEKVCPISKKFVDEKKAVDITSFVVAGKYLYFVATVGDMVEDEYGVLSVKETIHYIGRIDLETGKEESILEEKLEKQYESLTLYGASSNSVLFCHMEGMDVSYGDPGWTDAMKQMQISTKLWNGKTGKITTLFEEKNEKSLAVKMVEDGKIYVVDPSNMNTYAYDLKTKEQSLLYQGYAWFWGGGYALRQDESTNEWHVYDLSDDKLLTYELEDQCLFVQQTSDKGVVVWQSDCGEDGSEIWFYYITYESLADGLQTSDMLFLFANRQGVF